MENCSSSSPSSATESTRIEVNVSEFARGEIAVKLRRDNSLLVHALHLDQFAHDNFFRKELVKTFPLPAGADVEKIRSVIRSTGILIIDIPMRRDQDAIRRSHEELLKNIEPPKSAKVRSSPLTVSKRTGSLGDIDFHQYSSNSPPFNIAEFLQSNFHPTFTPNGKKIILKVDTRGYQPEELTVRLFDSTLLVQGRKKSLATSKEQEFKQFSQSIRLPIGIDKYNVTSQIMDDGMLVIDIPLLNSVIY